MSAITERDLKKAAKIWGYCVISNTDCSENFAEFSVEISELANNYANKQLKKLGVNYPHEIQTETQALKFVLREKRLSNGT